MKYDLCMKAYLSLYRAFIKAVKPYQSAEKSGFRAYSIPTHSVRRRGYQQNHRKPTTSPYGMLHWQRNRACVNPYSHMHTAVSTKHYLQQVVFPTNGAADGEKLCRQVVH